MNNDFTFSCCKPLPVILAFLLLSDFTWSQINKQNIERGHSLQFITGATTLTDSFFTAGKRDGTIYGATYTYYVNTARRRTFLSLQYGNTAYDDTTGSLHGNNISFSLGDAYAITKTPGSKFSLFAGYIIGTGVNSFVSGGRQLLSWVQTTSLAYYQTMRFSWGRQVLSLDVKVPLLSLVSRPADNYDAAKQGNFNSIFVAAYSNAKWTNVFKSPVYCIGLNYDHKIIDRLLLHLQYQYDYQKITTSKMFVNMSATVGVGLKYNLR